MTNEKPIYKPQNPNFSSGPTTKRPNWSLSNLEQAVLGRSHRAEECNIRLKEVIERSKKILGLPKDYVLGIMPGSDTGNGGNGSDGIRNPASPGTAPGSFSGSTLSGDTFNISLGTCNTANGSAHNHNILIRVVLASGHYLSAISFST